MTRSHRFPGRCPRCWRRSQPTTTTCSRATCSPMTSSRPGSNGRRSTRSTRSASARILTSLRCTTTSEAHGPLTCRDAVSGPSQYSVCTQDLRLFHLRPCRQHPRNSNTCGLVCVWPHVAIGVEGGHRTGVPKPLLDNLHVCLLYTSDAADEEDSVDLGGRR